MSRLRTALAGLIVCFAVGAPAAVGLPAGAATAVSAAATAGSATGFTLYDNTAYTSAPAGVGHGAVRSNLVPNYTCTPLVAGGALPGEAQWEAIVSAANVDPSAPLVLDCESLYLNGTAANAADHLARLSQLQSWARKVAAPGQTIGWYGLLGNTSAAYRPLYQQLIQQDGPAAFFPSAYTFSANETTWSTTLTGNLATAAAIATGVPVYPYIWPQYHQGSSPDSLSLGFVPAAQWSYQLATLHDLGLGGAVVWGGSNTTVCDPACQAAAAGQGWLAQTRAFLDWTGSGADRRTDLARGATATASSVNVAGREAPMTVDGDPTTRWGSQYSDAQWLSLDLGAVRSLTGARLVWETAYGTAYSLQGSTDGSTWTTLHSTTTGAGGVELIGPLTGSARYVRLLGSARGTSYGYSLWSLNLYGG
ncbi:discoidin domain-containing protein [Kitasatospora sp. NPDC057223]|uniref:discoidin domain-containing protein n=1 Tax=Kitasatospora sp. NPDC057223 TaxID=3346055 RepID=UPI003626726A